MKNLLGGAVRAVWSLLGTTALAAVLVGQSALALDRTWIGGNVDWVDGGSALNWNPADEPDSDDRAIFNSANTVDLGSNNSVNGLALSGGIDLSTNNFDLTVDGLVEVGGAGTNLFVAGAAGSIDADDVVINSGGLVELRGGSLTMDEEVATSLVDINFGGVLQGNGVIQYLDAPAVGTLLFVNDGTLTALSRGLTIFSPPPAGSLTITDSNANGQIDLDGASETGVVRVNRNQTLVSDLTLRDDFNSAMTLFHNATFDFNSAFTMATGGSFVVDNGFVAGGLGFSDIPADTSYIATSQFTQNGGLIDVVDTDGTLQLDANFTMAAGSFSNAGTVVFDGANTSISTAAGYEMTTLTARTVVNGSMGIIDLAGDFNWDGPGSADTVINTNGSLSITTNRVDTTDNVYGGDLTLNGNANLTVNVVGTSWTLAGTLTKNDLGTSTVNGDRIVITGAVTVNASNLNLPAVTTTPTTMLTTNALTFLGGASEFGGGNISGTGSLVMEGTSSVIANTTVSTSTFDWDGNGTGTTHTIDAGIVFTINSPTLDGDGDMDDPIALAGSGSQLIVNGPTQWMATAALNANNAGAGTSTIGGTSRMILSGANAIFNVNGNTDVDAPTTFGANSSTSIDAAMILDVGLVNATYAGGTISGAGTYSPGSTNTITANSTINVAILDFDGGIWTVQPGVTLVVNVTDYDTTATNAFDGTITLDDGDITVVTGDAFFVMDGTLNIQTILGNDAVWDGEPIHIGNDAGALDANINVTGNGQGVFATNSGLTFNSDADVDIAAGTSLRFLSGMPVTFNSVSGANNAEFTGAGRIEFTGNVFVNEATTLNMTGGIVDFDSTDTSGATINVDAPFVINAATVQSYGNANTIGGPDTIDVNNSVGTGVLTVNLDSPSAEWTINGPGVMNLVNDITDATLLAGSDVNIDGTLNVTGDVRTTARLDIAGVVSINTAAQPLRLAGGSAADPNTLAGGTISGPGLLAADTAKRLTGFGAINTSVDFDGTADLLADNGMLTISGAILDVSLIGSGSASGILNVTNPWNSSVATTVINFFGGEIRGGTITVDNPNGIIGKGLTSSRVVNNSRIGATRHFVGDSGTHVFQTVGNDNDWDGAAGTGTLLAEQDHTLELRDVGAAFGFTGTVEVAPGGRVFANGFALDFNSGSMISLTSGTYESTASTDIGGTVTVAGSSKIKVANNSFLSFETGSNTTLTGNLTLENNNIIVEQGAVFTNGGGALVIPDGSHMVGENLASIGVLLDLQGAFRPGNSEGIGRVDLFDYQQGNTGELFVELTGTALNAFDRLVASGDVVLDGFLSIDIDGGFVPVLGNTFNIITGNTVTGEFDYADVSGMPAGLAFHIEYLANAVQLQVVTKPIFDADFDDDGDVDPTDLAIWQGAYNLNQLGDADGDNDSDGRDFLIWQRQFGSAPLVAMSTAVPEPNCLLLVIIFGFALQRNQVHKSWKSRKRF